MHNIDFNKTYLITKNYKQILSASSFKILKDEIKHFDNPTEDLKVYCIDFSFDAEYKYPLIINCTQTTITPKLNLVFKMDDMSLSITYIKEELSTYGYKYGFKKKSSYKNNESN